MKNAIIGYSVVVIAVLVGVNIHSNQKCENNLTQTVQQSDPCRPDVRTVRYHLMQVGK